MSCGGVAGGSTLEGVDVVTQSIIQGVVVHAEQPVGNAYVRLLDRSGEFAAEIPTSATGQFRFFAAPGDWILRVLAPTVQPADRTVTATRGRVAEVRIRL
ncbi:MAG: DUF1416 domain-containing protein [Actinomycetota bacterium]|nr:DUF1416 domain-containing protein [Actinomycetota bacterium]